MEGVTSMPGVRHRKSGRIMKKVRGSDPRPGDLEDMLPEYAFDYREAWPNRFAPGVEEGSLIVR